MKFPKIRILIFGALHRCCYTRQFSLQLATQFFVARQVADEIVRVTPPLGNLSSNEKLCCELQEM